LEWERQKAALFRKLQCLPTAIAANTSEDLGISQL
jgi:hypothetical protein